MQRYMVVAHRTLGGPHLLEYVEALRDEGPCRFHLVVPVEHPRDHMWTDGETHAAAEVRLQAGLDRFRAVGIVADGEVGDANPVYAIGTVLRREGEGSFAGIILSTLPTGASRWLSLDVPSRVRREFPGLSLVHVVAAHEHAAR